MDTQNNQLQVQDENIENLDVSNLEQKNYGVAFDVVINPASSPKPSRPLTPRKSTPNIDNIKVKLRAAEERRKSMEADRLSQVEARRVKEQQVRESKQEQEELFAKATEEKLKEKFEIQKEKYESRISSIIERNKAHECRVEKVRELANTIQQGQLEKCKQKQEKRDAAEVRRQEQFQETLMRLKEHDKQVEEVRRQCAEMKSGEPEAQLQKLEVAMANREIHLKDMQDKLLDHDKHCEEVRQAKEELTKKGSPDVRRSFPPGGVRTYWGHKKTSPHFSRNF